MGSSHLPPIDPPGPKLRPELPLPDDIVTQYKAETTTLVAFNDGSYKKIKHVKWKHSQWIHYTLKDGTQVSVNPANVNYLHVLGNAVD